MNLSQEYIDLMERLQKEGQNHGILLTPNGPEIDLIHSTAKATEELKKPAEEMKANLILQEAKVISGEEK
jgi:hypothetical protein